MRRVAMPGYAEVPGNRLVLMLRRDRGDSRSEFTMVTLWEDLEAIRSFTGLDAEQTAVFYPATIAFSSSAIVWFDITRCTGATGRCGDGRRRLTSAAVSGHRRATLRRCPKHRPCPAVSPPSCFG